MIELYDHQKEAVQKLKNGSILAGGVGSGKSATSIAYYLKHHKDRVLFIITTAKKRDSHDWEEELRNQDVDLSIVEIDSWNNIKKYKDVYGAFFIFDEQRVVGKGAWVKAFLNITRKNKWILLSATPGDKYEDYIPVFVANGFFKNRTDFMKQHVILNPYITKYPKIEGYINKGKLNYLRRSILVQMSDPRETIRIPIRCTLEYNKKLYMTVWKDRWNPFDNEPIQETGKLCYLLRRVVNTDPSRVNKLVELIYEHPRTIIFYNYDYELELIRDTLDHNEMPYTEWNGHKHEQILTGNKWAYIVHYMAGAEAWNCIDTDTIIFYSQTYSYKTKEQAAGRIDRMNTPFKKLYYYNFTSFAPIDVAIGRALEEKRKFNELDFINGKS